SRAASPKTLRDSGRLRVLAAKRRHPIRHEGWNSAKGRPRLVAMNRLILVGGIEAAVLLAARGPSLEVEPLVSRFPSWVLGDALLLLDQILCDAIADFTA